ncbi:MAG: hypothetical protein ABII75_01440 [Candidatus Omnitrophota bacterium]
MRDLIKRQLKAVAVIIIYQLILFDTAQAAPLGITNPQTKQNVSTLSPRVRISPEVFSKAYQIFSELVLVEDKFILSSWFRNLAYLPGSQESKTVLALAEKLYAQFQISKQTASFIAKTIAKYGYPNIYLQPITGNSLSYELFRKSLAVPEQLARPHESAAKKLIEKFAIKEQNMLFLRKAIEEYGYENVYAALEIMRENPRKNRWIFYAPQTVETFSLAIKQFGKEKILRPLVLKNISTPIPGDFEIMPATALPDIFEQDMSSQYLAFFPQDLENSFKFKNGKSRKDRDGIDHVPGALAFIQFHLLHNKLVATSIQSDVYGSFSNSHKKKFKDWPEMMIEALIAFALEQNISQIIIPDPLVQIERFGKYSFPENIAKRIYEEAPANCGFVKLKGVTPSLEVEDFSMNRFWVLDLPADTNRPLKIHSLSAFENKFVQEAI